MEQAGWLQVVVPAAVLLLTVLSVFLSLRARRRQQLIDDIPTSKVAGVFIGLVEVKGTAEAEEPLTSYLVEAPCVHYQYEVSEHWEKTVTESYQDRDGKTQTRTRKESGWTTIQSATEMIPFYLQDDTGILLVCPSGATIEPAGLFNESCRPDDPLYYGKGPRQGIANSTHRRSFVERAIPLHSPIYVLGQARERDDVVAPQIAADEESPLYLISTRSEERVRAGYRAAFAGWFCAGLIGAALGAWGVDAVRGGGEEYPLFLGAGAVLAYLLVWLVAWIWLLFNSLIDLKNRVDRAWSQIDVELKRRHDLIPRLLQVVQGFRDYENRVHQEVVLLRSQAGGADEAPRPCKRALLAIAESYPELKSNPLFLELHESLVETEERIALARSYCNESMTQLNTRVEVFPEALVAKAAGLRRRSLLQADDFERAQVRVQLYDSPGDSRGS